jgi:nucleotide-binding universal stress UspA family protein
MSRFKEILVPVDFSEHSTAALKAAIEFARVFGSKLHLLHCYQIQPGGISPYGITIPSSYFDEIRDAASQQLAEWQENHVPAGVSVDASMMSEVPSKAIIETAKKIGADLIVMGTRGLSGFQHVMLGSVAERTVRLAPCPVMTVHAPGSARADGDDD